MPNNFFLFSKLPAEIRIFIWEAALPRRFLVYDDYTERNYEKLGPPAIAQVCHESREIALRNGSPHSFMLQSGRLVYTWYDASRDVISVNMRGWSCPRDSDIRENIPGSLYDAVTSITINDRDWIASDWAVSQRLSRLLCLRTHTWHRRRERSRKIDQIDIVVMNSSDIHTHNDPRMEPCEPEFVDRFFGGNEDIMVDLLDDAEVGRVREALNRHNACLLLFDSALGKLQKNSCVEQAVLYGSPTGEQPWKQEAVEYGG